MNEIVKKNDLLKKNALVNKKNASHIYEAIVNYNLTKALSFKIGTTFVWLVCRQ